MSAMARIDLTFNFDGLDASAPSLLTEGSALETLVAGMKSRAEAALSLSAATVYASSQGKFDVDIEVGVEDFNDPTDAGRVAVIISTGVADAAVYDPLAEDGTVKAFIDAIAAAGQAAFEDIEDQDEATDLITALTAGTQSVQVRVRKSVPPPS